MTDSPVETVTFQSSEMVSSGEAASCIRCGLCLATCPVYRVTLQETDTPRGKIALLRAVNEGRLDPGEAMASHFYDCLLCGSCANVCPSGVPLEEVLQAARDDLSLNKLQPEVLSRLGRVIWEHHNISGEDNAHRLIWTENMAEPPLGARPKDKAAVAYFVGCVGSFFPRSYRLPQTMVQLLDRGGVDYSLLGGKEWCCGYPLLINGQIQEAGELIEHNLAAIRDMGVSRVVFTCPSCLHIWHHVYTEAAGGTLPFELMHATELLADLIDEGTLRFRPVPAQRVTYHDPCDLGRRERIFEAPRRVLRAIPGVELVEMVDHHANSHCCGGGGNLETFDAELSHAVSDRRLRQAQEIKAEVITSACQQCERTLTEAARRNKVRVRVMDVAELALSALEE